MRIELEGVSKRFGKVEALKSIDLQIASGRRVALIGPNGSGKSTLTRILIGLLECDGRVAIDGIDPRRDQVALARAMAYVPQIAPQFRAPVSEIVAAIASVRGLEAGAISAAASRLDLDIATLGRRAFRDLSGGMKQKLLLALAFATTPKLLLMDEPTASLDSGGRDRFYEMAAELPTDCTVILCSHRLDEIRHLVDDAVALADGSLAWHGPVSTLLATRAVSVIEVQVRNGSADAALQALGFRSRTDHWWTARVDQATKMSLLPRLTQEIGATLVNVVVRDLETIDGGDGRHG